MSPEQAQAFVEHRIQAIYERLQQGKDVAPAQHLKLEGQVELLLQQSLIQHDWLKACVEKHYQQAIGQALPAVYWRWMADRECFYLPIKMQAAPVFKN